MSETERASATLIQSTRKGFARDLSVGSINYMACPELIRNPGLGDRFDAHRFRMLHPDGKHLIAHWFERAWSKRGCAAEESFEPFIFCWIALNGWAACCTELDQDRQWLDALIESPEVRRGFETLLEGSEEIRQIAERFRSYWPVFKAQELRRLGALAYWHGDRPQTIDHYLRAGARQLSPDCWLRHHAAHEDVPLDFPHTAVALYRVRCNLFHGDKAPHSEVDRILVSTSFRLLAEFLNSWDLLR